MKNLETLKKEYKNKLDKANISPNYPYFKQQIIFPFLIIVKWQIQIIIMRNNLMVSLLEQPKTKFKSTLRKSKYNQL